MQQAEQTEDTLQFLLHGFLQRPSQWIGAVLGGANGRQNLIGPVVPQNLGRQYGLQHLDVQLDLGIQPAKFIESGNRTKAQHGIALQEVVKQYACGGSGSESDQYAGDFSACLNRNGGITEVV